jgi:hypothetical protein
MSKAPKWDVSNYYKQTRKKRPGRHKKKETKMKKGWEDIPRELELKND